MNRKHITTLLSNSSALFIAWCFIASFGAYFCMYAFRKPFNAAEYEAGVLFGMSLKTVLIFSQVIGYMLSKIIGVKVISELKKENRVKLIIALILIAEIALLLFGLLPTNIKFIALFANGIPLGMVWGVVFSFLEGRRMTELIATGLSVSAIVSSGSLKTFGRILIENYGVNDFWMPAIVGLVFLPLFLGFVWMLKLIPEPTEADIIQKSEREPMTRLERFELIRKYGFGILLLVITYALFSTFRDFRDNFAVEIWNDLGSTIDPSIYTWTELPIALIVIITTSLLVFFKDNRNGLIFTFSILFVGLILLGGSTLLFNHGLLTPMQWMIINGLGLYMAYVPFQIVMYERLVALFRMKGNAGYLMYLSDSVGYLGSVGILFYKEGFSGSMNWLDFFKNVSLTVMVLGVISLFIAALFFIKKYQKRQQWIISKA